MNKNKRNQSQKFMSTKGEQIKMENENNTSENTQSTPEMDEQLRKAINEGISKVDFQELLKISGEYPEVVSNLIKAVLAVPGMDDDFRAELENQLAILDKTIARNARSEELNTNANKTTEEEKMTDKNKDAALSKEIKGAKNEIAKEAGANIWVPTALAMTAAVLATGFDMVLEGDTSKERIIGTVAAGVLAGAGQQLIQRTLMTEQSTLVNSAVGVGIGLTCAAGARFGINHFSAELEGEVEI